MSGAFKVELRHGSPWAFFASEAPDPGVDRVLGSGGTGSSFPREVVSSVPLVVLGFAISFCVAQAFDGSPGAGRARGARGSVKRASTVHAGADAPRSVHGAAPAKRPPG